MGWLITFCVLFLLAILPLGASVIYDSDGVLARVILGPIRFTVFPRPKKPQNKKEKKPQKKEKKEKPAAQKPKKEAEEKKSGGSFLDFLPLVKVALDLLGSFRRKLRLNNLQMKLVMAGGDPCNLAVNYGRAWAALGNLVPQLEKVFVIKNRDLDIACDFTASETLINARVDLTITLGRILSILAVYGCRGLKEFLKIKKKRNQKGGAE